MVVRRVGVIAAVASGVGFAGLGVVLAPQSTPVALLLGSFVGAGGFAVALGRAETAPDRPRGPDVIRRAVRTGAVAGGAAAAAVLTVTGMSVVLGAATVPVLLVGCAAAAPWVWSRLGPAVPPRPGQLSAIGSCPVEPSPAVGSRPLVSVLDSLSTPALCAQWQRSFEVLTATTDAAAREQVVALRRRYLDELERRDPRALGRWLAADSCPASGNPARHLSTGHGSPPRAVAERRTEHEPPEE